MLKVNDVVVAARVTETGPFSVMPVELPVTVKFASMVLPLVVSAEVTANVVPFEVAKLAVPATSVPFTTMFVNVRATVTVPPDSVKASEKACLEDDVAVHQRASPVRRSNAMVTVVPASVTVPHPFS